MTNKQYHTAVNLAQMPKYSDQDIECLAGLYRASAQLRARMSFGEFMLMPYSYLAAVSSWPPVIWNIDLVNVTGVDKVWITTLKPRPLVIAAAAPIAQIEQTLKEAFNDCGKPDMISLNCIDNIVGGAVRAACRLRNIAFSATVVSKRRAKVANKSDNVIPFTGGAA